MRHKPMYNDLKLVYQDLDGYEYTFQGSEISTNKKINMIIGMPVKDSGARYITSSDLDFKIDAFIINGEVKSRIISQPDTKPIKDNNSRRGAYRKVKVIETT